MSQIGKLLLLASFGRSLYSKWLYGRLVSGVITLIILAIITSVMASAMLMCCIYAVYLTLLFYGILPLHAFFVSGGLVVLLTVSFLIITLQHLRNLRKLPTKFLHQKSPIASHVTHIVDAFIEGFNTPMH